MADKKINIHIGSSADLRAMKSVSTEAVLMTKQVKSANMELRQAILKTAADYESIAAKADRAARGMGTGYKTLGDFLREIKRDSAEADKGLEAIRAKIQAAEKAAADAKAARAVKKLGENANGASGKVRGLSGMVRVLSRNTGFLGATLTNLAKGSLWEMGAAGVRMLFGLVKKSITDQIDAAKEAEKKSIESINALTDSLSKYKSSVAEVGNAVRAAADKALSARQKEIDLTERLTKANAELARQKRIAAGEDAATVNSDIDAQLSANGAKSARERADAEIEAAQNRLDATIREHEAAVAEVNRLKDARQALGESWNWASGEPEALKAGRKYRRELTAKIDEARATETDSFDRIKGAQGALDDARRRREALEVEIEAEKMKTANPRAEIEIVEKFDEYKASSSPLTIQDWLKERKRAEDEKLKEYKKKYAEFLVATRQATNPNADDIASNDGGFVKWRELAKEKASAELAAAQKVAAERDRLDRELHAKRMADLRAEIAAQKEAASPFQAVAASAATEFERAFAMYRDPSRAAAEIGEEKDRAEDLERLHRDASRYGGKWRIDELSQLMAAGDSQGVDSRLAEWRKSRSFSPEVEAMVRASAAEQTKTTVEDELRKIEMNTSDLAAKLDELITMKGE